MNFEYRKDQELPAIAVCWETGDGSLLPLATGYTLSAKICLASAPTTIVATKTSGVTGADTFPNATIEFTTSDFTSLTASADGTQYIVYLYARRDSDSKDRVYPGVITFTLKTAPA